MKKLPLALFGLVAGLVVVTVAALECGGVAVVETRADDGTLRSTRVWFAEPDGELWLEAGSLASPWFDDLRRDPWIRFSASQRSGVYRGEVLPGDDSHAKIRGLLREKYGLRDVWVGLLINTSGSVAVRLGPPG